MGLTIHWELKAPKEAKAADIQDILEIVRNHAKTLPVAEVGETIHLEGAECLYTPGDKEDEYLWPKISAEKTIWAKGGGLSRCITPTEFYSVSIWPGEGCESCEFIFAKYPRFKYWQGRGFCKTQYANKKGFEHFVKCHLSVVNLLDCFKSLNCLQRVSDEGDYWKSRDLKKLAKAIGDYDKLVAAIGGMIKDTFGAGNVEAPILSYPNFEQLEFRGLQQNLGIAAMKPKQ